MFGKQRSARNDGSFYTWAMNRTWYAFLLLFVGVSLSNGAELIAVSRITNGVNVATRVSDESFLVQLNENPPIMVYNRQPPENTRLSVESGGFIHPFRTPAGEVVTGLAPSDHPHHRGIFLAFVEMHGKEDADFWGWGQHAPKDGRKIVNKNLGPTSGTLKWGNEKIPNEAIETFPVENIWEVDGKVMLTEQMNGTLRLIDGQATVLELDYKLTPENDIWLARWAFSGFCVRTRADGTIRAESSDGEVKLPDPIHTKPESDWPDKPWYAFTIKLASGKNIGVAVINHPENPPTLWHNHRQTRMINPCIVAPAEVKLKAKEPLRLRYKVVAWDGETPGKLLSDLHSKMK